ncbi:MAG: hypothetical protein EOO42_10235, partial [Flavobacteriales bacterium]
MTTSENLVTRKEITDVKTLKSPADYAETLEWHEKIDNFSFGNYHINDFFLVDEQVKTIKFSTNRNLILMQFCLDGECTLKKQTNKATFTLTAATHNSFYIPKGDFYLDKTSTTLNLLHIYVDEDFFFRQMPDQHEAFDIRVKNLFNAIFSSNIHIGPKIKSILVEVEN